MLAALALAPGYLLVAPSALGDYLRWAFGQPELPFCRAFGARPGYPLAAPSALALAILLPRLRRSPWLPSCRAFGARALLNRRFQREFEMAHFLAGFEFDLVS